jgi:oligoribonuclease (3'-5' exoribonuclease)
VALLCFGARALDEGDAAARWAQDRLEEAIAALPPGSVVLAGGARGPDTWAREVAGYYERLCVEYRLDGYRWRDGVRTEQQWTDLLPESARVRDPSAPPSRWPLLRDDAMVEALVRARANQGWEVSGLGLSAFWSHTRGTEYTAARLAARNVPHLVHPCPREHAPPEASEHDLVFLDLETSGRSHRHCAILEIAAVRTDPTGARTLAEFACSVLPFPSAWLDPGAAAVNGIHNPHDPARGAVGLRVALERLAAWLPDGGHTLAGYNVDFDDRFLDAGFARAGIERPPRARRLLDVMDHARELHGRGKIPNMKLSTVREYYGLSAAGAHTAAGDIGDTVTIYRKWKGIVVAGDGALVVAAPAPQLVLGAGVR